MRNTINILFFIHTFSMAGLSCYGQIDSLPKKKWFLKGNGNITVPFNGKNFNMAFSSVAALRLTKRLNMHEYGLQSINYQSKHTDLRNYTYRYFNVRATYQYNLVLLKKTKIKPYLGINNDVLLYYEYTTENASYERKVWNYGVQNRMQLLIGAIYLYKNRFLFDLSISPFRAFLFETGYRLQQYDDLNLPSDERKMGGFYFNNTELQINRLSDIFQQSFTLKFGFGIKI